MSVCGNNCTIKLWRRVNQSILSSEISPVTHLYDILKLNPFLPVFKYSFTCNLIWIEHTHIKNKQLANCYLLQSMCVCEFMSATPAPWFRLGLCRSKELRPSARTSAAASSSWCSSVFSASLTSEPSPGPEGSRAWIAETALPAPCSWTVLHEHTYSDEVSSGPKEEPGQEMKKLMAINRKRYWLVFLLLLLFFVLAFIFAQKNRFYLRR